MKQKVDYLYDGSFEGFLTCVHSHYYEERAAGIYPAGGYQSSLVFPNRVVVTDAQKAEAVYDAIEAKISRQALQRTYHIFLSSDPEKDNIAFRYLCLGFRLGGKIFSLHSDPIVFAAQQTERKVSLEVHRLMGLIRFSVLQMVPEGDAVLPCVDSRGMRPPEILYAKLQPDHDVLELLGEHFSDRFKNEPFILHDERRRKALFSQQGNWYIAPLDPRALPEYSKEEKEYRRLWKQYFESIAIEERKNPKCQKRFMPVRYWKNLTEMN